MKKTKNMKEYHKLWYLKNKIRLQKHKSLPIQKENDRRWRKANKKRLMKLRKKWLKNNGYRIKKYTKKYYHKHKIKCQSAYKKWLETHRHIHASYVKKWHKKNKDKVSKWQKKNYKKKRHAIRLKHKAHYNSNKNQYKIRNKKWFLKNKRKAYVLHKKWIRLNRKKYLIIRKLSNAKRRSAGYISVKDVMQIGDAQKWICYYCSKYIKSKYHIEHYMPVKLKGKTIRGNIVLSCKKCNYKKGWKHPVDFLIEIGRMDLIR